MNGLINKGFSRLYPGIDELSERIITDYLLRKHHHSEFSAIDIGAGPPPNYYQIFLKYTKNVYCVEPALDISGNRWGKHNSKLLQNAKAGKVKLFNGVISDVSGDVVFHKGEGNTINSSLDPGFRLDKIDDVCEYMESFSPVKVQSLTYRGYIDQNGITDLFFVKVDVEGAEGKVLSTMDSLNSPQILLLEVAYDTGNLKQQIKRLMGQCAFTDSLFISRQFDLNNSDVIGEYRFNDDEYLSSDKAEGSLFLATEGLLNRDELLALRSDIRSRLRFI